jgi:hypothetical protein
MNFLQLGQDLALECGVSGTLTTMAGQIGSLGRIVSWVNKAWLELQTEHDDWDWMRSSSLTGGGVIFNTVSGQSVYPLGIGPGTVGLDPALFAKWDRGTFRNYTTAAGFQNEIYMDDIPYDVWRNSYMYGAMRVVQTRPIAIAISPTNKALCIGPPSNGQYTITGDYFVMPSVMVNDIDVPFGIPLQFHRLITYIAMQMYGSYEAAPEVTQRGMQGEMKLRAQLEVTHTPEMTFGGALA